MGVMTVKKWVSGASMIAMAAAIATLAPGQLSAQTAQLSTERSQSFAIPAQDLNTALLSFARTAGMQVFYEVDWVQGRRSADLSGSFTPSQGLDRLLSGSGLAWRYSGPNTVTLSRPAPAPANQGAMTLDPVMIQAAQPGPAQAELGTPVPAYAGGQVARGAKMGLMGNRDVMDTPFNVTSYTAELMENQEARTVADVLENDPSVRFTVSGGHMQENFRIRGLDLNASDVSMNGLYGLSPTGHVPIEMLERVEVLKGPNALLNGMNPGGSVGGNVNVTTKRAADTPTTRITEDFTSDGQFGTHVDVGRRFGGNDQFGIRFNGLYRDGDAGVEDQEKRSQLAALNLDYRGEKLRLSLDAYTNREDIDNGSPFMANLTTAVVTPPDSDTNLFRGTHGQQEANGGMIRGEYDITDDVTAYAAIGQLISRQNGLITSTHAMAVQPNGAFRTRVANVRNSNDSTSAEAGVRGKFETGEVKHQMVLAVTSLDQDTATTNTLLQSGTANSNIYNPIIPPQPTNPGEPYTSNLTTLNSVALADTLSAFDDRAQLTLGLRRQSIDSRTFNAAGTKTSDYDKHKYTPAVGVLFKPVDQVSLYGNYIEALTKGSTVTTVGAANFGQTFDPTVSKQHEIGVKWDAGSITNTLSLFQIKQATQTAVGNTYLPATQRNRGVEWNVFGEITPQLRALGGITYTQAEYTKHPTRTLVGKDAYGVPSWQGNLGLEWDPPLPEMFAGLTLEGRAVYTGRQWVNSANTLKLDDWWRFDVGARYVTPIHGTDVTIRAYVTNLFDRDYWVGSFSDGYVTMSEGRTFMLSTSVDF